MLGQNVEITCDIAAGDGLDLTGFTLSTDLKSNGGAVIESNKLAIDLGASSITGTLAISDGGTGASSLDNLITLGNHRFQFLFLL